jgi:hypothetical protein
MCVGSGGCEGGRQADQAPVTALESRGRRSLAHWDVDVEDGRAGCDGGLIDDCLGTVCRGESLLRGSFAHTNLIPWPVAAHMKHPRPLIKMPAQAGCKREERTPNLERRRTPRTWTFRENKGKLHPGPPHLQTWAPTRFFSPMPRSLLYITPFVFPD